MWWHSGRDLSARPSVFGFSADCSPSAIGGQVEKRSRSPVIRVYIYRSKMTTTAVSTHRKNGRVVSVFVNKFTIPARLIRLMRRQAKSCGKGGQRVPSRTVRRVHVMPWATPIRRIGLMQLAGLGPEDGAPSGLPSTR